MTSRRSVLIGLSATALAVMAKGCTPPPPQRPIVLGYSSWAGWWPWAIGTEEGLFKANGVEVEMRWFDGYLESIQAFAGGQIDGNAQTLNDTISIIDEAVVPPVVVLVNDNSAGNDKIIVREGINTIEDLLGKKVAIEEGVVDDFLLALALDQAGYSRDDVEIVPMETGAAAAAFVVGQVDAVGAFPPFWATALQRPGSKELISSAAFPGAIPDLLVVSQTLVNERPQDVQAIVNTWFDIRKFMAENPQRADEIMAVRAGVTPAELKLFADGIVFFSAEDNLEAFSDGNSMKHMPYAAKKMADFMVSVGFIPGVPNMDTLFDDQFIRAYLEAQG
ncbi:ABC transporter substrate-binding protein [Thermosynechococcaceae cyanobacterium Okahandja]